MIKRTDIEIMAPVGCYESLHAAINAGANSVYFGIGRLNMRSASAANFSEADMEKIVEIAHNAGVKTYLTVNTIIYDDELQVMQQVVNKAKEVGVDAIIASDLAVITYAYHVGVEVHISTQCNISNSEAVKFFSQWADVVVLAREVSLEQIAEVASSLGLDFETAPTVAEALAKAHEQLADEDMLFIGGSTFVVAEALE